MYELEIQQLLNQPVVQQLLRRLGKTFQTNSTDFRALVTEITAFYYREEIIPKELSYLQQLIHAAKEKVHHFAAQLAPSLNSNIHHARHEEINYQNQQRIQAILKELEDNKKNYQKLQKELNETLAKNQEVLEKKAALQADKAKLEENKANLIKENNPELDPEALQKRTEQINAMPSLGKAKQGIEVINIFRELGFVGPALLRLNQLLAQDENIKAKLTTLETLAQANGLKLQDLFAQLSSTEQQINNNGLQLQQLGVSIPNPPNLKLITERVLDTVISNVNQKVSKVDQKATTQQTQNDNVRIKSAGFKISPFTWIKKHIFSKNQEKEEESLTQTASKLTPRYHSTGN